MGHTRCQNPHRGHLLGLVKLSLKIFFQGDIPHEDQYPSFPGRVRFQRRSNHFIMFKLALNLIHTKVFHHLIKI